MIYLSHLCPSLPITNIIIINSAFKPRMHKSTCAVLIICLLTVYSNCFSEVHRSYPANPWQLKIDFCPNADMKDVIIPTSIPSVLHLDLLRSNKIPDPFFGDNYKKLEWISSCNVTYSTNITFESNTDRAELVFEGIDTYSSVYLNGKEMVVTNNSFVEYRVRVDKSDIR